MLAWEPPHGGPGISHHVQKTERHEVFAVGTATGRLPRPG